MSGINEENPMKYKHPKTAHLPPTEEIVRMYQSGLSHSQIAEKLNTSTNAIQRRLRSVGVGRTRSEAAKNAYKQGRLKKQRYWAGKTVPKELVRKRAEAITGEKNYLWKGGLSRRKYREVVKKEMCATCGRKKNLVIHHKDLDHYNNDPNNLEVLCRSCHQRLHKKLYWDAIKAGKEPPKSNGPIGWER
jgi:hypothetical protein